MSGEKEITAVTRLIVNAEMRNWMVVKIETAQQISYRERPLPDGTVANWRYAHRSNFSIITTRKIGMDHVGVSTSSSHRAPLGEKT